MEVFFAKQSPKTGIQPHSDGCNFILTAVRTGLTRTGMHMHTNHSCVQRIGHPSIYTHRRRRLDSFTYMHLYSKKCTQHLGLDVPEGQSWIKVGGQKREWKNGKAMAFDTHYFHETGAYIYVYNMGGGESPAIYCICGCVDVCVVRRPVRPRRF